MRKNLLLIANRLSEADILQLFSLKKQSNSKAAALKKKRDKLAADLASLEKRIAKLEGSGADAEEPARRGPKPIWRQAEPDSAPTAKRRPGRPPKTERRTGRPLKPWRRPGRPARADAAKPA